MFVNVFLKFRAIFCQMTKPKTTETLVRQTPIQDFLRIKGAYRGSSRLGNKMFEGNLVDLEIKSLADAAPKDLSSIRRGLS